MCKIIDASCVQNNVTIEGVVEASAKVLSEGVGASEGVALIEDEKVVYIAKTTPDLKTTITKLSSLIDNLNSTMTQITGCFTALDALPTISGACASFTAAIIANQATLTTIKTELETLKGMMK